MRSELRATRAELKATKAELQAALVENLARKSALECACGELEISRDRFQDLYHLTPHGCITLDRDGRILEANLAAATLLKRSRGALLRGNFAHFVPKASAAAFRRHLDACLGGAGQVKDEMRIRRATGEEFQAFLQSAPLLRDKTRSTCQMTLIDDTERWTAVEALRASEERYHELADSVSDPYFALDDQLRCTYLNTAAARLIETPAEAAAGKTFEALLPDPQTASRVIPVLSRVLRTRHPESLETPWPGPGGELHLEAQVYRSRSGLSVFARDISLRIAHASERERLIGELAAAREQAEQRAGEAEQGRRTIAQAMEDLERTNRELDQFAVVVAHDLSEPLRTIAGFAQLTSARCRDRLDERTGGYLTQIAAGAARMQGLLDELLRYSRIDQRHRRFAPTDLNVALDQALANLSALVEETAPRISRERLPVVAADENQMVQLLQNLLANAMKYRREPHPRIEIRAEEREGEVVVSVRDDGIGIAPEHFERIFGIFRRLHGPAGPAGAGVGLAICKKIVERHRGRIWVESEPGVGSTFFFSLPKPA